MKQMSIVLFLVVGFQASAFTEDQQVHAGFQGGLNFASLSPPSGLSPSARTGFMAGINVEIPMSPYLFLQPEANFSQRGAEIIDAGNIKVNAHYSSIEIPLFLKAKFSERSVRPFIFAGPSLLYNFSSSVEGVVAGQTGTVSFNPRTVDFAVAGGAGVDIESFFASLRFQAGLIDVDAQQASWYSRGVQLIVGVYL